MTRALKQSGSEEFDIARVVDAVASVVGGNAPLHAPEIAGKEWEYVKACLDSGWVSSVGAYVDRFEGMLAAYTGAKHAIATVNGTAALHACLVLAGVEAEDEVIVPALTFVAPVNAISYCGATPHFVDSEDRTLGLDAAALDRRLAAVAQVREGACINRETGRRIAAVLCVHIFGHAANLDALAQVCEHWQLDMIEDAAESLGSHYNGVHTGNHGRLSALSFNGNKIVTTGGGGAILTNDPSLAKQAKHLTTTAKMPHAWEFNHDRIGFNYRLPNINAAMGCAQMERLDDFLSRKRALAARYETVLGQIPGIDVLRQPSRCQSNYWLNAIALQPQHQSQRDLLLAALNDAGMMSRPAWTPANQLDMFRNCPSGDLTVTESLAKRAICLPSSPNIMDRPITAGQL